MEQKRIAIMLDLASPYSYRCRLLTGIHRYFQQKGQWKIVLDPFALDSLSSKRGGRRLYDGIIGRVTSKLAIQAQEAINAGVPIINLSGASLKATVPRVLPDNRQTGFMAAEHLTALGFQRFGYLGFPEDWNSSERQTGFQQEVESAGFKCCIKLIDHHYPRKADVWHEILDSLEQWVRTWEPPIGVFVLTDLLCRYLADVCLDAGLRIPDDVALVGWGNEQAICEDLKPTITSIEADHVEVGYRAAQVLDDVLHGAPLPQQPVLVGRTKLIPRFSTDVYVVDDHLVAEAIRFIRDHYSEQQISVEQIVRQVPLSRRSLERRFRDVLGHTVYEEIIRCRLEHSKKLLRESKLPIQSVASACGFPTAEQMTKVYRRKLGVLPSAYRKANR